jgi:hypothetical protein
MATTLWIFGMFWAGFGGVDMQWRWHVSEVLWSSVAGANFTDGPMGVGASLRRDH